MSTWRERVVTEKAELETRLLALDKFLENDDAAEMVGPDQYHLMLEQQSAMEEYLSVLCARLDISEA